LVLKKEREIAGIWRRDRLWAAQSRCRGTDLVTAEK